MKTRYFFSFNLISFGIFARLLCSEECLPGLFENAVSPKSGVEIYLSFLVVNKSRFSVVITL